MGYAMDETVFDTFCRTKGLHPVSRETTPYGDIFIAETELELDRPAEFPWGYFQTFYCIGGTAASKNNMDIGQWLEFDAMHDSDKGWTPATKRQARLKATRDAAQAFIDANVEVGRYHAG